MSICKVCHLTGSECAVQHWRDMTREECKLLYEAVGLPSDLLVEDYQKLPSKVKTELHKRVRDLIWR